MLWRPKTIIDRTRFRSDRCGRGTLLLTFQLDLLADPGDFICRPARGLPSEFRPAPDPFPGRLGWYFIPMIVLGALISFVTRNLVAMFCFLAAVGAFLYPDAGVGEHHFLPVAFWLFPAYIVATGWLAQWLTFVRAPARLLPFTAAGAAVFVLSIVPGFHRAALISLFVPRYATFPLHLDN